MVATRVPLMPIPRVNADSLGTAGALGGVALMWTLPFLWTTHLFPMPSLYSELAAASCLAFALLSCALLKRDDAQLQWPLPALLLGLTALALTQQALGMLAYAQLAIRFLLFTSAMLAAYVFGRQIVAAGRTVEAVKVVCTACLLGGIFSVLVQWLQLFDLEILPFWLAAVYKSEVVQHRPFGNLAQANHQATYLALAAMSALYVGRITRRSWLAPVSLLLLASGMALTGSRMGAALLALLMLAQFAPSALRPEQSRSRWLACVAMVAGYGVALLALRLVVVHIDTLERPLALRHELWRQAWEIGLQHPMLGIGVGQFGGGEYWVARPGPYTVPATHCHNVILELAAELGWPAAVAAAGVALCWGLRDLRSRLGQPEQALAWGMLVMIAIHSMLEFPLWYLFFAIPAALLFGLGEPVLARSAKVDLRRILPLAGITTLAVVIAFEAGYPEVAAAATPLWLEMNHFRKRVPQDALPIIELADSKLFRPEVEHLMLELKHPPDEQTAGPLERNARLLRMLPDAELSARYIAALTKAGRIDEAILHVSRLRVFAGPNYPLYRDSILDDTRDLGPQTAPLRRALREKDPGLRQPAAH
jgi:O-antigen ligase